MSHLSPAPRPPVPGLPSPNSRPPAPDQDVLVRVENVSKKFCRSLKRSLWYGVKDVASSLNPFAAASRPPAPGSPAPGSPAPGSPAPDVLPPLRADEFWAVQNVSFELRRGECLGLIGHNGAGKSTLLKILNGLIPPDTGRITMKGRVGALIELNAGFNPILTGRENIYNQAALLGFSRAETDRKLDAIVDFAEIGDFLDMPVQNYSSGMRVRLGFAVAAQMEPDVLIIDEVLAVGDVAFRFKCLNAIGELMKSSAVIFVTHTMTQVFRICTEAIVLDHGRVTCQTPRIADAVAVYLSLFSRSSQTITGSAEVRVRGLQMASGENRGEMGDEIEVEFGGVLSLTASLLLDEHLASARLQFLLWNSEMLPILDIMGDKLMGFEFGAGRGAAEVRADIGPIHINSGKYSLSVIATSADNSRVLCRHDNAAFVRVKAATASGAHVLGVADWSSRLSGEAVPS